MDCEKFEHHLMDALYGDLDEVTGAALKRHAESCPRCSSLEAGFKATLEVGLLPLEQPSDDLEQRILEAAHLAQRGAPWHRKLLRTLSWAGSQAMRPQLAMAALLLLVLGSTVLLLRPRPGSVAVTPVKVTERGAPHPADRPLDEATDEARASSATAVAARKAGRPEQDEKLPTAIDAAEANDDDLALGEAEAQGKEPAAAEDKEQYERAVANYRAGRHREAQRDFAAVAQRGGPMAPTAGLYEARSVRSYAGCRSAIPHYVRVRSRFSGNPAGADATWEQADCHRMLGEGNKAQALWQELRSNPEYRARAEAELSSQGRGATTGGAVAAPKRAAAPAPSAPAKKPVTEQAPAEQAAQEAPNDEQADEQAADVAY